MFRDVRLVRVTIYPVQYDSKQHLLLVRPRIELVIDFVRDGQSGSVRAAPSVGDQHLATIAGSVLNPEQLQVFRGLPAAPAETSASLPLGVDLFKIGVVQDGNQELN